MSAARWAESILVQAPVRLVLGGAFVLAGWMKLFHGVWEGKDPALDFIDSINGYKILDPAVHAHAIATLAYVMPWAELLCGVLLILGVWARSAALVVGTLLVGFTGATISVIMRPEVSVSCSCFGDLEWPCSGEITWCQVVRNVVLLAGAAYLVWRGAGAVALGRDGCRGGASPSQDALGDDLD